MPTARRSSRSLPCKYSVVSEGPPGWTPALATCGRKSPDHPPHTTSLCRSQAVQIPPLSESFWSSRRFQVSSGVFPVLGILDLGCNTASHGGLVSVFQRYPPSLPLPAGDARCHGFREWSMIYRKTGPNWNFRFCLSVTTGRGLNAGEEERGLDYDPWRSGRILGSGFEFSVYSTRRNCMCTTRMQDVMRSSTRRRVSFAFILGRRLHRRAPESLPRLRRSRYLERDAFSFPFFPSCHRMMDIPIPLSFEWQQRSN